MSIIFENMTSNGHEELVFCSDNNTGLKAIIAIHNTTIGPALGGCRMWNYSSEAEALNDVLRLSRGMSYKAAIAGLNLGGGKAVIIGDSKKNKNEILFRSFGRFVQGLAGRYITAEDVGTSVKDMEWVRMETEYVTGLSRALGGGGDPGPVTALGTFSGIRATVKKHLNKDSLVGLKIAIQGVGHVGYHLTRHLKEAGAEVFVSDLDQKALKSVVDDFGAKVIEVDEIYGANVDIYSPCAMGSTLNDQTIPKLKCSIVAGSANNQLKDELKHSEMLKKKDILYAPDYAINSGGLINCANEIEGYNRKRAFKQAEGIYDTLINIYERADNDNVTTHEAALKEAKKRIDDISKLKNVYLPKKNLMGKRDNL
jgi:leucine dehydrogenase